MEKGNNIMKTKTFKEIESKMFKVFKKELTNIVMNNGKIQNKRYGIQGTLSLGDGFMFGGGLDWDSNEHHWNSLGVLSTKKGNFINLEYRGLKGGLGYSRPIDCWSIDRMEELYNKIMECVK